MKSKLQKYKWKCSTDYVILEINAMQGKDEETLNVTYFCVTLIEIANPTLPFLRELD